MWTKEFDALLLRYQILQSRSSLSFLPSAVIAALLFPTKAIVSACEDFSQSRPCDARATLDLEALRRCLRHAITHPPLLSCSLHTEVFPQLYAEV